MKTICLAVCIIVASFQSRGVGAEITENEIYSLDTTCEEGKVLSVTVDHKSKHVSLTESNVSAKQRFIPRINSDNTFTLFSEDQPWNWVDHIVERTKYVNIKVVPKVLAVIGGSKEIVEQNYQGKGANGQKWYIVPTGGNPNVGVLSSLLLRQCLVGNGENQLLSIATCNWTDPNQIFTVTGRTSGRFC